MKVRVKSTGKIVEVREEYDLRGSMVQVFYSNEENPQEFYEKEDLDFSIEDEINTNYWNCLEHKAAIAAMQGVLFTNGLGSAELIAERSIEYAHTLVNKLKEKEERK